MKEYPYDVKMANNWAPRMLADFWDSHDSDVLKGKWGVVVKDSVCLECFLIVYCVHNVLLPWQQLCGLYKDNDLWGGQDFRVAVSLGNLLIFINFRDY